MSNVYCKQCITYDNLRPFGPKFDYWIGRLKRDQKFAVADTLLNQMFAEKQGDFMCAAAHLIPPEEALIIILTYNLTRIKDDLNNIVYSEWQLS